MLNLFPEHEIWKLQRPIHSNEYNPPILAYTENKTKQLTIDMPMEDWPLMFGDVPKVYVHAELVNGTLNIIGRAPEQDW